MYRYLISGLLKNGREFNIGYMSHVPPHSGDKISLLEGISTSEEKSEITDIIEIEEIMHYAHSIGMGKRMEMGFDSENNIDNDVWISDRIPIASARGI